MLALEHIGDPPRAEFKAFIAHGAGVGFFKLLPVRHRPRVGPAPCVNHAFGFELSELHPIRPAHGRKGAHAAGKAAGKRVEARPRVAVRIEEAEALGVEIARYDEADHGFVHDASRPTHRADDAADASAAASLPSTMANAPSEDGQVSA